jgi:hypothetical protein
VEISNYVFFYVPSRQGGDYSDLLSLEDAVALLQVPREQALAEIEQIESRKTASPGRDVQPEADFGKTVLTLSVSPKERMAKGDGKSIHKVKPDEVHELINKKSLTKTTSIQIFRRRMHDNTKGYVPQPSPEPQSFQSFSKTRISEVETESLETKTTRRSWQAAAQFGKMLYLLASKVVQTGIWFIPSLIQKRIGKRALPAPAAGLKKTTEPKPLPKPVASSGSLSRTARHQKKKGSQRRRKKASPKSRKP